MNEWLTSRSAMEKEKGLLLSVTDPIHPLENYFTLTGYMAW